MFGIGTTELIIVLAIVLLLFGAKRIPDLASSIGKGFRELQKSLRGSGHSSDEKQDEQS